jgi:hypothetical protein
MSRIHARVLGSVTALLTAVLLAIGSLAAAPASAAEESLTVSMGWPQCVVGQPCSATADQTLSVTDGTAPYTYEVTSGTFPPGLTLSESGDLSGVPTGGGEYTFTVTATDADGLTGSTTGSFFAYGIYAPSIVVSPNHVDEGGIYVLPGAEEGAAYSQTFTAAGGTAPYTFSIPETYSLPDGLTLSPDGVLSGTPTTSGEWDFGVVAIDSSTGTGPYNNGLYMYELDIAQAPAPDPVTITTEAVQPEQLGQPFSQQIEVIGGSAPYDFYVSDGALPDGLTLDSNGVLSGTPTATGQFSFTITVTADTGGSASRAFTTTIDATRLVMTPDLPLDATVGTPFTQTFGIANGLAPYTYGAYAPMLPPGLALTGDGVLSGTPTAAGAYTFLVVATDSATGSGPNYGAQFVTVHVGAATTVASDADGDGLSDADEARFGTDPSAADTDHDGLDDGAEVHGIQMTQRVRGRHGAAHPIGLVRPNPLVADTDHDGLSDGTEVHGSTLGQVIALRNHRKVVLGNRSTNPVLADTDHDGLRDRAEVTGRANRAHHRHLTDPTRWDTDRGGVGDGREVRRGSDPADFRSGPHRPHRHSWVLRGPRH